VSKMKPMTARNRASAIVIALLGAVLFLAYACSAKADSMLGKLSDPQFMGVKPGDAPEPERWVIQVMGSVDGRFIGAGAQWGHAEYPSSKACADAVLATPELNDSAANAAQALKLLHPDKDVGTLIVCAMKVD